MSENAHGAWLTAAEVAELTARVQWSAQRRMLTGMGVPFRPNGVGRPLVERAVVLRYRGKPERSPDQPNWGALTKVA